MQKKFCLLILSNCLAASYSVASTETLSLESALKEGVKNSPKVIKSQSQAREGHWKKYENYSLFLPTLTLTGSDIFKQNYMYTDVQMGGPTATSVPQIIPSYLFTLSSQWSIFDGFVSTHRFEASEELEKSATSESEWTQFQTEKEITLQYYRVVGAQLLKEVAQQNLKALEDHLREVQLFKKAGVSTRFEVLKVEVQVSEARSELMNVEDNYAVARNKLSELLGREQDDRALLVDLPPVNLNLIKDLSVEKLEQRKDIQASQRRVEAYEHFQKSANLYWMPKVNLFGQYSYYNNRNTQLSDSNAFRDAYQVGLSFSWNLFDGLASQARAKAGVEQKVQAEQTLRQQRLKAIQDFEFWKKKYNYFSLVNKFRLSDVEKATESVRLAKDGRRVGARTNTDLLDAETELYRAKAAVVNSQVGALEALINLELTVGTRLMN